MLIEKLQEQLAEFDKKAKLNVRLIQRKERLAYVTVNLTNIIQVIFWLLFNSKHSCRFGDFSLKFNSVFVNKVVKF